MHVQYVYHCSSCLRDRSLLHPGGRGGGGFGGGAILEQVPFGGKFFTGKKHERGQIL